MAPVRQFNHLAPTCLAQPYDLSRELYRSVTATIRHRLPVANKWMHFRGPLVSSRAQFYLAERWRNLASVNLYAASRIPLVASLTAICLTVLKLFAKEMLW